MGRDGTGRDGTGRDGTGRDGTGRDGTGRDGTGRDGTAPAAASSHEESSLRIRKSSTSKRRALSTAGLGPIADVMERDGTGSTERTGRGGCRRPSPRRVTIVRKFSSCGKRRRGPPPPPTADAARRLPAPLRRHEVVRAAAPGLGTARPNEGTCEGGAGAGPAELRCGELAGKPLAPPSPVVPPSPPLPLPPSFLAPRRLSRAGHTPPLPPRAAGGAVPRRLLLASPGSQGACSPRGS